MEVIFHLAPKDAPLQGVFGTLYQCAVWLFEREGIDKTPDSDDPLESVTQYLADSDEPKYSLEPAVNVIPRMISIDEALRLRSLPADLKVSGIPDWLAEDHTNDTLKQMVDLLHGRTVAVRWRGSMHSVGASPFTPETYSALLSQLS